MNIDYIIDGIKRDLNNKEESFYSHWSAPSNIALVKYWGKKEGIQIPANPSLSVTLDQARTEVELKAVASSKDTGSDWIQLIFEGQEMPSFLPKIEKFFNYVKAYNPYLKDFSFQLNTSNSFPHSAGIASSASSMAAIACCLVEFEQWLLDTEYDPDFFLYRSSFYARLGSGSACRSLFPKAASWGSVDSSMGEEENRDLTPHDLFASPVEVHPDLENLYDTIVIVDSGEKKVSSRAGHGLMKDHPYAHSRFIQANQNWNYVYQWLKEGQWDYLGAVIEEEALALHAMMMTSRPGYLLMAPQTIKAIELLRQYRHETGVPLYFTLDAGPNLHILYPKSARDKAFNFIQNTLLSQLEGASLLDDQMGSGALNLAKGKIPHE
ncbi:MAG: diphosphomevalonate decarboxylase [Halobacteriovoraceae bacterium]|nr:diphosphomevalonate decarboxylase [Halobacteriovoraceae bacterium]|tara:strand:+ start:106773 stop:107912 length:1140 start_codon:yes stop_codon:yes gene_type:complete